MSGPEVFSNPYASSKPVVGRIVTVLRGITDRRGLYLEALRSRAVSGGQIHELMLTDESAELESTVNHVALIAFFEVIDAGVILVDSTVSIAERTIGQVAGFDETHMPNHQNICLRGSELQDGASIGVKLNDEVRIESRNLD